ncbi:S-DNA-T family DNA segregation ATPase FtsK/SpoIIIE [Halopolyspora algeriensis]|uniref:S-DNA-T family DNA segregation ATPase FtsK/SpoIIIE n=1 Tax=Halopolyspora algeriensis TaxID=1500506 RepID=A0A368VBH8_9ACTN|nr:zonular occludens toxin domain-containing protein [Halopolyspora algeriensis]RCW38472.1 S-DNA-T family DNA segregation ATPase FtsK/SpoIIIE [Halopolyspora algeriensis]TQM42647.1 S-DNA-T family DNA segregation ATPase FtsK/SpoIIIE [Halopolyspora algeriensis]
MSIMHPQPEPEPIEADVVPLRPEALPEPEAETTKAEAGRVPRALAGTGKRVSGAARRAGPVAASSARATARHGYRVATGAGTLAKRATRGASHAHLREQIERARAAGDVAAVAEWHDRLQQAKAARARTLRELPHTVWGLTKVATGGLTAGTTMLVVGGIGAEVAEGGTDWNGYWATLHALAEAGISVATVVFWVAVVAGPAALLLAAWSAGGRADPPRWLEPAAEPTGREAVPDEGAILGALKNLGLPALNRAFRDGWSPRWVLGTGRDGKGWRTQLELPPGVTVGMLAEKKDVLAHNLVRLPVEVWPTEPHDQPGVLDLWVADQGILRKPVDPWPLLKSGAADYFRGVPVAVDQRGDVVTGKLMAANYGIAGIMGSGKTSIVVNLVLGAMLDPLVDIDVHVLAFNADYDPMRPRLRELVKGDDDEQISAAMDKLRELRTEVTERGRLLEEAGETKNNRKLAEADPRMRPRVVVFDEVQELFRHDEHGKEAKELAIKVMTKARKTGITLVFVTPAPSADSLPRDLAKTTSHRVCFAIGDHQGNDAILGTGAHKQGVTATSLVPGEDIGTAMASGFANRPGLIRAHHVKRAEDGQDQVTPVVKRAMELREKASIRTEGAPAERRELLADVLEVTGTDVARAGEVVKALAARWSFYSGWKIRDLVDALGEHGIRVPSTDRQYPIDPEAVRAALHAE